MLRRIKLPIVHFSIVRMREVFALALVMYGGKAIVSCALMYALLVGVGGVLVDMRVFIGLGVTVSVGHVRDGIGWLCL